MARLVDTDLATSTRCEQMVPPWIQRMRDVARKHLTEDVVEQIVTNQIQAAKNGDRNAIRFVFDQLMGGAAFKGATFVQNNYGAEFSDDSAKPTTAPPGSQDKLDVMRRRVANGQSLCQKIDQGLQWACTGCGYTAIEKPSKCPKCGSHSFEK